MNVQYYSNAMTPVYLCRSPSACSKLKIEFFEPDPDAFVRCALEDIATVEVGFVWLWVPGTVERASVAG